MYLVAVKATAAEEAPRLLTGGVVGQQLGVEASLCQLQAALPPIQLLLLYGLSNQGRGNAALTQLLPYLGGPLTTKGTTAGVREGKARLIQIAPLLQLKEQRFAARKIKAALTQFLLQLGFGVIPAAQQIQSRLFEVGLAQASSPSLAGSNSSAWGSAFTSSMARNWVSISSAMATFSLRKRMQLALP